MKKIRSLLFCLAIFLLAVIGISAQKHIQTSKNNDDWVGKYTYTYTEPANAGGFAPVIEYVLIVSEKGGSLVASLTADGTQSNDDYRYTAKAAGNQLNLYLSKHLDLDGEPKPGRRVIKGQLSGTLIKSTIRGRTRYVFRSETLFGSRFAPVFKKKS